MFRRVTEHDHPARFLPIEGVAAILPSGGQTVRKVERRPITALGTEHSAIPKGCHTVVIFTDQVTAQRLGVQDRSGGPEMFVVRERVPQHSSVERIVSTIPALNG